MSKDEALKLAIEALPELIGIAQNEYESQAKAYDNYPNMAYRYDYIKDIADEGTKALNACKEALEQPAQQPDRTGMVYYKNNACKAKNAKSPDCICWTPEQPCQECENLKHDLDSYMKMAHAYANQKPLSDDKIQSITWKIWGCDALEPELDFARAIEKAHGIGE